MRHVQALDTQLRPAAPLSAFLKPDGRRNHPDTFRLAVLDDAKRYVLDTATSAYHGCGTAAMQPREKGGVVDPKLVVYGTENIRVVDASVFPLIPRGNILSSVYAVAEKAAEIIRVAHKWLLGILAAVLGSISWQMCAEEDLWQHGAMLMPVGAVSLVGCHTCNM